MNSSSRKVVIVLTFILLERFLISIQRTNPPARAQPQLFAPSQPLLSIAQAIDFNRLSPAFLPPPTVITAISDAPRSPVATVVDQDDDDDVHESSSAAASSSASRKPRKKSDTYDDPAHSRNETVFDNYNNSIITACETMLAIAPNKGSIRFSSTAAPMA